MNAPSEKGKPTPKASTKKAQPKEVGQIIKGPWHEPPEAEAACSQSGASTPVNVTPHTLNTHSLNAPDGFREAINTLTLGQLKKEYPSEYNSYRAMKHERCIKMGFSLHPDFGDFPSFLRVMGPKPDSTYTLDRIDPKLHEYSPANCRWASKKEQALNKTNTVYLTDPSTGQTRPLVGWAEILDVSVYTLRDRKRKGWTDEEVLHGKASADTPSPSKHRSIWEDLLPDRDPKIWDDVEALYQRKKRQTPDEPRDVFLYRCALIKRELALEEIDSQVDLQVGMPVPAELQRRLDSAEAIIERTKQAVMARCPGTYLSILAAAGQCPR